MANIKSLSNWELKNYVYGALEKRASENKPMKQTTFNLNKEPILPSGNIDFYTHHTRHINTNMSCLQGEVTVGYSDLLRAFGEPSDFHGDKVDWEWIIEKDGVIATIYNWKNGPKYGYKVQPSDLIEWNIGGHSSEAVDLVKSILLIHGVKC